MQEEFFLIILNLIMTKEYPLLAQKVLAKNNIMKEYHIHLAAKYANSITLFHRS